MDNETDITDSQARERLKLEFAERLNRLLKEKSLSQRDLARLTNEKPSKISEYCRANAIPAADTAVSIADALDVSVPFLIFGRPEKVQKRSEESAVKSWPIPVLDIRLSAGAGAYRSAPLTVGEMVLDEQLMLQIGRTSSDGLVMMRGEGDSMEPLIRDGAPILIDENDKRLREGFIYAFRLGDDLRIKRLRPVGLGDIEISSVNSLYPPEIIHGEMRDHFEIIGRVLLTWTRL